MQANVKTREGADHPDRDAQFQYINDTAAAALKADQPVISVDTKNRELVGEFKNGGASGRARGSPSRSTRMISLATRRARRSPTGSMTSLATRGGCRSGSRATLRVSRSRRSPRGGAARASGLPTRVNPDDHRGLRRHQQRPRPSVEGRAARARRSDRSCVGRLPLPRGTTKWNKIEHRLFSFISHNGRGKPLIDYATVINLIASTTTSTGLKVYARLDETDDPKGVAVSDREIANVNLTRHAFHGDWNYTVRPRPTPVIES